MGSKTIPWADVKTPEDREIDRLTAEVERLTTSGIAEVAAHNPSVMDWMKHWEDRTLKAEAEVERLKAALETIANGPRDADKTYPELFIEVRCEARAALNEEPRKSIAVKAEDLLAKTRTQKPGAIAPNGTGRLG